MKKVIILIGTLLLVASCSKIQNPFSSDTTVYSSPPPQETGTPALPTVPHYGTAENTPTPAPATPAAAPTTTTDPTTPVATVPPQPTPAATVPTPPAPSAATATTDAVAGSSVIPVGRTTDLKKKSVQGKKPIPNNPDSPNEKAATQPDIN